MAKLSMRHFWDDKFWDRTVHQHFYEQLYFFLVRTKPFRPDELIRELNLINNELKLGSVRTFKILGLYDLLVRAWLHPHTETKFVERLKRLPNYQSHHPFKVETVESRWYLESPERMPDTRHAQFVAELDHEKLEAIETGRDMCAYERYRNCGLAVERSPLGAITFFIGVNFDVEPADDGLASIIVKLREYIRAEMPGLQRVTIDRGTGFCRILIKGESLDFYEIGKLPSWIGQTFYANQVFTETYLSHGCEHIAGNERISTATLDWMGGFDPFARSIVPNLYPKRNERLREDIERFLRDNRHLVLTTGQRLFLEKFLSGVLEKHGSVVAQALFLLFWDLEGFLAKNYREFLGRVQLDMNQLVKECKIQDCGRPTLMDLFQLYTKALQYKGLDLNPSGAKTKGWNGLVDLRNHISHSKGDPLDSWRDIAETALCYWEPVRRLADEITKRNGGKFEGTFWP